VLDHDRTGVCHVERASTPRTVAAYQAAPPWAVGTPTWFRSSAIARSESPRARSRWMGQIVDRRTAGGRPSRSDAEA
jgi:hypothetical protein